LVLYFAAVVLYDARDADCFDASCVLDIPFVEADTGFGFALATGLAAGLATALAFDDDLYVLKLLLRVPLLRKLLLLRKPFASAGLTNAIGAATIAAMPHIAIQLAKVCVFLMVVLLFVSVYNFCPIGRFDYI